MTDNMGARARWLIAELAVEVDPQHVHYVAELRQLFDALDDRLKAADQALEETVKHYEARANTEAWAD